MTHMKITTYGMHTLFLALSIVSLLTASALPCRSESKKPERVMYFFAHQDDEVDVVAKITADLRDGKDVIAVWETKGDKGGDPVVREKETRSVMKLLNVPEKNLIFLGYPDQGAYLHLAEIYRDLCKLIETYKPTEITSHAYEGGNIDHDAVAFVAAYASKRFGIRHLEFPDNSVYKGRTLIWKFLPNTGGETLYTYMNDALFKLKMQVNRMYPSQATGLSYYELSMDKKSMKTKGEPYRVAPDYDFTKPPAEEFRYGITSKGHATYEMWSKAVSEFLSQIKK